MSEFEKPQFDEIPPGTFEAISGKEASAMLFKIKIGRELQIKYPTIADDYRSGLSVNDIIKKYNIPEIYKIKPRTAESAIGYALGGYDGDIEIAQNEEAYPGLIENKEELAKIGHEHNVATGSKVGTQLRDTGRGIFAISKEDRKEIGRKSGLSQYEKGIGIHAQTPEERKRIVRLAHEALGSTIFSDEEIKFIQEKIDDPEYKRKSRVNVKKLSEALNQKFHNGHQIRNQLSVTKFINRNLKKDVVEKNLPEGEAPKDWIDIKALAEKTGINKSKIYRIIDEKNKQ